jgi:hypothetical protein
MVTLIGELVGELLGEETALQKLPGSYSGWTAERLSTGHPAPEWPSASASLMPKSL